MVEVIDPNLKPLNQDLKTEMIDISVSTPELEFKKNHLEKKEEEYMNKHLPYCGRCAIGDFRKKVKDYLGEYAPTTSYAVERLEQSKHIKLDLDDYGKPSRFDLVRVRAIPSISPDPATGMNYLIGYKAEYVCKIRGCRHIVHLTIRDYERMVKAGKLKRIEVDLPLPREYKPE